MKNQNYNMYEVVLSSDWCDIKKGETVYVQYRGNTNKLRNQLSSNSQFSIAESINKVEGDYPLHLDLCSWLDLSN